MKTSRLVITAGAALALAVSAANASNGLYITTKTNTGVVTKVQRTAVKSSVVTAKANAKSQAKAKTQTKVPQVVLATAPCLPCALANFINEYEKQSTSGIQAGGALSTTSSSIGAYSSPFLIDGYLL